MVVYGCEAVDSGRWHVCCQVAPRTGATALSFDLGFAFFTRREPTRPMLLPSEDGSAGRVGSVERGMASTSADAVIFFSFLIPCTVNRHDMQMIEDWCVKQEIKQLK